MRAEGLSCNEAPWALLGWGLWSLLADPKPRILSRGGKLDSCTTIHNWVLVSNIFYFPPYLGKIPILINIFQRGWNHQLDNLVLLFDGRNLFVSLVKGKVSRKAARKISQYVIHGAYDAVEAEIRRLVESINQRLHQLHGSQLIGQSRRKGIWTWMFLDDHLCDCKWLAVGTMSISSISWSRVIRV